jgi:hypothetical protein
MRVRKVLIGLVATTAAITGSVVAAPTASADPSPQVSCDSGSNRHFRAYAAVEPTVGGKTLITGYRYKVYGAIGDKNNLDFELRDEFGRYVPGTWTDRDEVAESETWVWVDITNRPLETDKPYKVYGFAKFDVGGLDPTCDDESALF